jgi:hypothetical protein
MLYDLSPFKFYATGYATNKRMSFPGEICKYLPIVGREYLIRHCSLSRRETEEELVVGKHQVADERKEMIMSAGEGISHVMQCHETGRGARDLDFSDQHHV